MTRAFTLAALMVLAVYDSNGQEPAKGPSFEVASITPCKPDTPEPPGQHAGMVQFTSPGGRFKANATTLKFLFEWAYGIQPAQHSSGPSWLDVDRYDVVAKAEGNPTDHEMKLMLQTLLAERFALKLHRDQKELSVFAVSLGKTAPKLYAPKDGEEHSLRIAPQMGDDQKVRSFQITATRFSLTQLTDTFARQLGRVIVNETGMDGDFDFTLELTPDEGAPNPLDPSHILSAMRDDLGLTIKSRNAVVPFLVIDSVTKVTAGN